MIPTEPESALTCTVCRFPPTRNLNFPHADFWGDCFREADLTGGNNQFAFIRVEPFQEHGINLVGRSRAAAGSRISMKSSTKSFAATLHRISLSFARQIISFSMG